MTQQKLLNELPARTWNWLQVNGVSLPWGEEIPMETSYISARSGPVVRLHVHGQEDFQRKTIEIDTDPDSHMTVLVHCTADARLALRTQIRLAEGAQVLLVQLLFPGQEGLLCSELACSCAQRSQLRLVQVLLGQGDVYSDCQVELSGAKSRFQADLGYIGQARQTLDMNLVVNHTGPQTVSEINVGGALRDAAAKTFRGTIDFRRGAVDAVGSEQENVLLLGEDVQNRTVPLILCAEENVEGTHGATIGELDADTLFYFESRGIDRTAAENMLARAAIGRLTALTGDAEAEELISEKLQEVLSVDP